jgi:hypothetical protein
LKNAEVEQIGGLLLSTVKVTNAFTLTKSGLGHILGDFLANSSGHPAYAQKTIWKQVCKRNKRGLQRWC